MKYFSMFSGVGGFELGLEGHECVGMSEIDKYSSMVLKHRFKGVKNYGDATKINTNELPEFDMLVGGFPCQSFSIAGKRRGFQDTRGTLFFEIARIVKAKKPKIVFIENVKGLLNHGKGKTFATIIQTLSELGYDVQWMVLNSKFFGVPQNRERVFIIGNIRGTTKPEILPFRENADKIQRVPKIKIIGSTRSPTAKGTNFRSWVHDTSGIIGALSATEYIEPRKIFEIKNPLKDKTEFGWHFEQNVYDEDGICRSIKSGQGSGNIPKIIRQRPRYVDGKRTLVNYEYDICPTIGTNVAMGDQKNIVYDTKDSKPEIGQAMRRYGIKGVSPPLNNWSPIIKLHRNEEWRESKYSPTLSQAMGTGGNNVPMVVTSKKENKDNSINPNLDKGISDVARKDVSPTITTELSHGSGNFTKNWINKGFLRRLTPQECERLQSFPDDWTLVPTNKGKLMIDTQRYKQMGNAVTVNVIRAISKRLKI